VYQPIPSVPPPPQTQWNWPLRHADGWPRGVLPLTVIVYLLTANPLALAAAIVGSRVTAYGYAGIWSRADRCQRLALGLTGVAVALDVLVRLLT
jgi:hypothetical protein